MKRPTTMTYAVTLALAGSLALAGCNGGDGKPPSTPTTSATSRDTPSLSPSASTTSSPSPSASASATIPTAARENTDDGAKAFVRYFFEQVNVAYTQPDTKIIPALSTDECVSCDGLQGEVQGYAKLGQRMATAPTVPIQNAQVVPGAGAGKKFVKITIQQTSAEIVDKGGKVVDTQEAKQFNRIAIVSWEGDKWLLNGLAEDS